MGKSNTNNTGYFTMGIITTSFFIDDTTNATAVKIPISNGSPWFSFRVSLSEDVYRFEFSWNARCERWSMSVYDQNDTPIFQGAFCVAGVNYIKYVNSQLWPVDAIALMFLDGFKNETEPTFDNLGKEVSLVYFSAKEQKEVIISTFLGTI